MVFLGHLGPLWPLQPTVGNPRTTCHGPWDPYALCGVSPRGPTSANFGHNLNIPKKGPRTQIGQEPHSGLWQPPGPPAQVQQAFPSIQGKDSPSLMYSVPRI
ncbi:hypothetical protein O181_009858 [Austropuccinia psidii MF-1]|uniref:Uncharacterized protein n=1 Tax=Austropuccinia psidii MF-1 TaxID=1389203 RepID=A0A9Q3BS64_9BASI|nr:hypothetical protein [Austropuccinia psidii MF-1]